MDSPVMGRGRRAPLAVRLLRPHVQDGPWRTRRTRLWRLWTPLSWGRGRADLAVREAATAAKVTRPLADKRRTTAASSYDPENLEEQRGGRGKEEEERVNAHVHANIEMRTKSVCLKRTVHTRGESRALVGAGSHWKLRLGTHKNMSSESELERG